MGAQGLRPMPRDSRCQGQPPARHPVKHPRKGRNRTMVLGLKPIQKKGFRQNPGLAWSSDSSLWGNQVLKQFLDRTKALYGPRTQAYGETKYSKKFWTEPRPCMVLGLKPMGKPSTQKSFGQIQGLAWSSDSSLWGNQVHKRS